MIRPTLQNWDDFDKYLADNQPIIIKIVRWARQQDYVRGNFGKIRDIADACLNQMPAVGWFSVSKRIDCFLWVCQKLGAYVENGELNLGDAISVVFILHVESPKFMKAWTMMDIRKQRYLNNPSVFYDFPEIAQLLMKGVNL